MCGLLFELGIDVHDDVSKHNERRAAARKQEHTRGGLRNRDVDVSGPATRGSLPPLPPDGVSPQDGSFNLWHRVQERLRLWHVEGVAVASPECVQLSSSFAQHFLLNGHLRHGADQLVRGGRADAARHDALNRRSHRFDLVVLAGILMDDGEVQP